MFYIYIEKINGTNSRQVSKKAKKISQKRIYNELEIFDNSDSETDEEIGKSYFLFIFLNIN